MLHAQAILASLVNNNHKYTTWNSQLQNSLLPAPSFFCRFCSPLTINKPSLKIYDMKLNMYFSLQISTKWWYMFQNLKTPKISSIYSKILQLTLCVHTHTHTHTHFKFLFMNLNFYKFTRFASCHNIIPSVTNQCKHTMFQSWLQSNSYWNIWSRLVEGKMSGAYWLFPIKICD